MAFDYQIILIAATGGLVRNVVGFLKARRRHGAKYKPTKLIITLVWSAVVGAILAYLAQGRALAFAPLEIVLMAVAGTVLLDELFQGIILKRGSMGAEDAVVAAPKPAK